MAKSMNAVFGRVAEWLGTGLQNPLLRFKSGRDLIFHIKKGVSGGIGIRGRLKICYPKGFVGSSPT